MSAVDPATAEPPPLTDVWKRYAVATGVVAGWMALGWIFHPDPNTYLLLGVPLLVAFQLLLARRPIAELWFDRPDRLALPWWGWLIAAAFMALPVYDQVTWTDPGWPTRLWLLCASAGAVPLAMSVVRCTRAQWKILLVCVALTAVIASISLVVGFLVNPHPARTVAARLLEFSRSLVLYLPVCFMIEEVFFRGGLDPYLARVDTGSPWVAATFVSVLWGWWHLPIVPSAPGNPVVRMATLILVLPAVHAAVGVFFTIFRRRTGLLLVPVAAHATIDAIRNALL